MPISKPTQTALQHFNILVVAVCQSKELVSKIDEVLKTDARAAEYSKLEDEVGFAGVFNSTLDDTTQEKLVELSEAKYNLLLQVMPKCDVQRLVKDSFNNMDRVREPDTYAIISAELAVNRAANLSKAYQFE